MNQHSQPVSKITRRRGMALVIVIGALALATMLLLAMFSLTESEYKATQSYVSGLSAKQFADVTTAIVQAQIQNGHNTSGTAAQRTIHATQPGMVRVYRANGQFLRALKLYSSSQMVINGNSDSDIFNANTFAPSDWHQHPARYVDLNEPVVRPSLSGAATAPVSVFYPVIDPRAAFNFSGAQYTPTAPAPLGARTTQVEGFWYDSKTRGAGAATSVTYDSSVVKTPTQATDATQLRLPMPVEWIYILQDGTMGTLNAANSFVTATPGVTPTAANPIVARIAFWTDDECCKININTAAEPTFMAPPYYFHDRDRRWAHFPGTASEYQRYPGHPATVALSAVLAPNFRLDPYRPDDDGYAANDNDSIVNIKEAIYDLAPKVSVGGSLAGTVPFINDDFSMSNGEGTATAQHINTAHARAERLYASVDEMLFKDGLYDSSNSRVPAKYDIPQVSGRALFDHDTLEKSRFFLTAHSRAPEFSIYGLPRVCMWPVADETARHKDPVSGKLRPQPELLRTNFDNAIALCATLQPTQGSQVANSYFFRRAEPHSSTHDLDGTTSGYTPSQGLARNKRLLDYLVMQMSGLQWPQTGTTGNTANYVGKYGIDNVRQLAVQFFDYIRCTNLYDGVLARGNDGRPALNPNGSMKSGTTLYLTRDDIGPTRLTYTEQRGTPPATNVSANANQQANRVSSVADDTGVLPGHGQVTPSVWRPVQGGQPYMGFGRMFTISEIGFAFICTADGKPDGFAVNQGNSPNGEPRFNHDPAGSGGGTALRTIADVDAKAAQGTKWPGTPMTMTNKTAYPNFNLPKDGLAVWWSNFPPLSDPKLSAQNGIYGVDSSRPGTQDTDVSDGDQTNYNHPCWHPGYNPFFWNMSLPQDTPLLPNQKRVQGIFQMETFCAMMGWTKFHPEYTIRLSGSYIGQIKLRSAKAGYPTVRLFDTTGDIIIKSNGNLYESHDVHSSGGHAGPTAVSGNRGGRAVSGDTSNANGRVLMGADGSWQQNNVSGHNGLANYGMTTNFVTVDRDADMVVEFPSGELEIKIYDSHFWENREPCQIIKVRLDGGAGEVRVPPPLLVYNNYYDQNGEALLNPNRNNEPEGRGSLTGPMLNFYININSRGEKTYHRSKQGPHWWMFNSRGCLGHYDERYVVSPFYKDNDPAFWVTPPDDQFPQPFTGDAPDTPLREAMRGRLDTRAQAAMERGAGAVDIGSEQGFSIFPDEAGFESDVVRTMVPAAGDYRMLAARYEVPSTMWKQHPQWEAEDKTSHSDRMIHTYSTHWGTTEEGYDLPEGKDRRLLVADINFGNPTTLQDYGRTPDLPETKGSHPPANYAKAANSFGDFDTGIGNGREGPYVNKPDEGNFYAGVDTRNGNTRFYRSGYFYESYRNSDDWRSGVYMTPNRMISSPVMFGSLPTGIWSTGGNGSQTSLSGSGNLSNLPCRPWQTLLFRPYVQSNLPGYGAKATHPGEAGPKDHFLLDMFFMPVVEPYAISEPLSVAGRINMNYQIMPFTHIHRATGMHAAMKGEYITAIPDGDAWNAKRHKATPGNALVFDTYFDERSSPRKYWHRPINVAETLVQFDEKFFQNATGLANGLFRSASEICDMHLIPETFNNSRVSEQSGESLPTLKGLNRSTRPLAMRAFWQNHKVTAENIRERPYSNLYSRLTTRSNTFRVHVRAQVVKKARSTDPAVFDPDRDAVLSEYRGSTLVERFIDPSDTTNQIPDYVTSPNPLAEAPLDTFYQFRVIESKRFNP